MAPRIDGFNVPEKIDTLQKTTTQAQSSQLKKEEKIDLPIRWRNVAIFAALHVGALYGIYLCFFAKFQTLIFCMNIFWLKKFFFSNFYFSLFVVHWRSIGNNCWSSSIVVAQNLQGKASIAHISRYNANIGFAKLNF